MAHVQVRACSMQEGARAPIILEGTHHSDNAAHAHHIGQEVACMAVGDDVSRRCQVTTLSSAGISTLYHPPYISEHHHQADLK
jgi:hypothetical protein